MLLQIVPSSLSKAITKIFRLFYRQVETYNAKSFFYSQVKTFWVIQNNEHVINSIKRLNKKGAVGSIITGLIRPFASSTISSQIFYLSFSNLIPAFSFSDLPLSRISFPRFRFLFLILSALSEIRNLKSASHYPRAFARYKYCLTWRGAIVGK